MKRLMIAGLALALCAVAPTRADPAGELRTLTEQRFNANLRKDRAYYERLLAPNFVLLRPEHAGQTRKDYLDEEFPAGAPDAGLTPERGVLSNFRAFVDRDTAVATYVVVEALNVGGARFESRQMRVDTYVRSRDGWRLLSMAVSKPPSWPDVIRVPAKLLDEYAGTYALGSHSLVVTHEDQRLMAQVGSQPKIELFAENETTFFDKTDASSARTIFERDASGKVVAQVYRADGQKLRYKKVK